ncbi:MAG: hypothetical protein R3224_05285, partial [Balneolaceae bacterium]|nr:hypothetical protein [Balneolaceae bacterium]
MASTTRRSTALIVFLVIVLCGTSGAQSTFFSETDTAGVTVTTVPSPARVHGFGVTNLSSYYPDSSYMEAYALAVEDLRANLLTSIYLESFITTMMNTHSEYAIRDSIDQGSVIKIDSAGREGKAYFFVTADSVETPSPDVLQALRSLAGEWTTEIFNPTDTENFWIAAGHSEMS